VQQRHCRRNRTQAGFYLIETLVAIILGALIAFALMQVLSESMRVTTTNANKQAADLMAQTVLDAAKATAIPIGQYNPTAPAVPIGQYDLLPYSTVPGQLAPAAPAGHPLPVGLDMGDMAWATKVISSKFPGTITLNVTAGPDASSLTSTVVVSYSDNQNVVGKTISTMTLTEPRGINYWPSP
jgi:type II secretory pathway pseudopilin PulG